MKLYKLLFLVPALILQVGCGGGSNGSSNNNNCIQSTNQPYQQNYPNNGQTYCANAVSQVCIGTYYWCPQGMPIGGNMSNCQVGQCMQNPDNCRGFSNMYTMGQGGQPGQPVSCQ